MTNGVDCAAPLNAQKCADLKALGYEFAGRYLVPATGALKWKALTKNECDIITGAGMKILAVWETTASRAKDGAIAGTTDGARAYTVARQVEMPTTGIIYFAVDYDAQPKDYDAIDAYLRAARVQTKEYEIGVYGSYNVIEEMYKRGVCKGFWQCIAWSYGRKSQHLTVYQATGGQPVAGHMVDLNECPDMAKAGIWDYNDVESEDNDMTVEKFKELWLEMRKELQDNDASSWSNDAREWAVSNGIVQGDSTAEFNGMWEDVMTREQMVTLLYRFAQKYNLK